MVDDQGKLVGIFSEGDLIHRSEAGTERQRPRWLEFFISNETLAAEYTKAHARKVADIMTCKVITAEPDRPLHDIAALLERNAIKRVPIVRDGQLVGIVSRANLLQAVATAKQVLEVPLSDMKICDQLLNHLKQQKWSHTQLLNVTVSGSCRQSASECQAIRVAAELIPGVHAVNDNLVKRSIEAWT